MYYKVEVVIARSLEAKLQELAMSGWKLHTAVPDSLSGRWTLILESDVVVYEAIHFNDGQPVSETSSPAKKPRRKSRKLVESDVAS